MRIQLSLAFMLTALVGLNACGHSGDPAGDVFGSMQTVVWKGAPKGESLVLLSGQRQRVATARVDRNGDAVFRVSARQASRHANSCLSIFSVNPKSPVNKRKKPFLFQNQIWKNEKDIQSRLTTLDRQYNSANLEFRRAESWLARRPSEFQGGVCRRPSRPRSRQPADACAPSEQQNVALGQCGGAMLLCVGAGELGGPIASQLCAGASSYLLNTSYNWDTILSTLASDVAFDQFKAAMRSENPIGEAFWGTTAGAIMLRSLSQCMGEVGSQCARSYANWSGEPERVFNNCKINVAALRRGRPNSGEVEQLRAALTRVRTQPLTRLGKCKPS